jgi:serine kinase of HPr protein (carbohydrate metabolism regulator)
MTEEALIHGSCVAIGGAGVLLLGKPGSGKSDLVLRLLDHLGSGISDTVRGALLVADDQVAVAIEDGRLSASAPGALAGKLEIRGLGIVSVPAVRQVELKLAVRLTPAQDIERMPDLQTSSMSVLGVNIPLVLIDPEKASAPARIRAALDHLVSV